MGDHTNQLTTVNIQPDVGILSVLRHLNYRPWFALAEFVDNSLQSFIEHRDELERVDGAGTKLHVEITIDTSNNGVITIRDNAAGIYTHEYERAFRPAEPPPDISGLSEFGIGMKSAACWFCPKFTVRSSALGENVERTVMFDIEDIVDRKSKTLPIRVTTVPSEHHYTEVVLANLHRPPLGRTIGKIKEHLESIYRVFIREGILTIRFRSSGIDELLEYEEPEILVAPPDEWLLERRNLPVDPINWRKEIKFDFGMGLTVSGFAGLRSKGSTSKAGFALFRRKRLIEGSGEDSYRPQSIFGASTTGVYQRLVGELQLEGFEISHTKDGFRWDDNEEPFLELLREELNSTPIPLLDQARHASYDAIHATEDKESVYMAILDAVKDTADVLKESAAQVLEEQIEAEPETEGPPQSLPDTTQSWNELFCLDLQGTQWEVAVEVTNDPAVGEWVSIFDSGSLGPRTTRQGTRRLGVRLSIAHPFMTRFVGADLDRLKPFVRLAAAIGLAEITASEAGARLAGEVRRNVNQLLRESLYRT
ncbi:ATP-binding protein [Chloroflexota bacterium]